MGEEFLMRSLLDDPAFGEDEDTVGVADGGEAVGDDEGGAVQKRQSGLDQILV